MIINATNIGSQISGIGRYSLSLSLYLLENWDYPFQLYINKNALDYFKDINHKIKLVSKSVSPDFSFKGHLLRLMWINKLSLQNQKRIIFNTSPLEASFHHKKQILMIHDLIPLFFPKFHKKQYHYFKSILPVILKDCVKILTVSNHTKSQIIDSYKISEKKISVIYNGVNDFFFNESGALGSTPIHQNYILYVGRLSPLKNIQGLIKALELLTKKCNLRLKLTGQPQELSFEIREEIRKQIDFEGNVSDKELIELYKNARLLILPSFYEGFGLPPVEAMACGCPVVVSKLTSLPEVCGEAAYYINPYNVESIAEGICKVATDEALRKNLIQKGLQRARLFSWEKSAKEHIKIFEEVLSA